MKIFLIGFMGCGKSTLGNALAEKLNYPFMDLDELIENRTGRVINQIFQEMGEEGFRKLEHQLLNELCLSEDLGVIALGGGTPCYFDNMTEINRTGISIYLTTSPQGLFERLKFGKAKRPLIKDMNDSDLLSFIETKIAQRAVYYEQAKLVFETEKGTADELLDLLKKNGFSTGA